MEKFRVLVEMKKRWYVEVVAESTHDAEKAAKAKAEADGPPNTALPCAPPWSYSASFLRQMTGPLVYWHNDGEECSIRPRPGQGWSQDETASLGRAIVDIYGVWPYTASCWGFSFRSPNQADLVRRADLLGTLGVG